ncbi:MAG: hypothetical protein HN742_42810 [Lentisphaerae bacterium]|jgi:hypothetical protein|nr:hypothetical protein [Lentisphaerota bacterium]MBT4814671.1 hypothetical protein [Lentisphaerota bacterium]MBT5609467.1 hypothetical protein [Lentisphaerota bacterium]MBT7061212.1 hypothetical protein [Lentisphaerota bacterium]MBT7848671.1 hypothetical protein [Lentisphaerota bacterium]
MPRRQLTEAEKSAMQEGRKQTSAERHAALDSIMGNGQFTKPKFWKLVDDDLRKAVVKAIEKARQLEKAGKISRLEAELARLKSE